MSSGDDGPIIEAQLGRPARARSRVVSRCRLGLPVVIAVPGVLDDGTPFPTHYWLTCPLAHRRIARLEAAGEVRAWERRLAEDPSLRSAMGRAHAAYAVAREATVPDDARHRPSGGVAGLDPESGGLKCLHTHYAHARAGGDNPVGAAVASDIEPLDCARPCVVVDEGGARRSPHWREPH